MIAMTFGVYLFVSFFLTVPFVVRYLIVSYREKKRLGHGRHHQDGQPSLYGMQRF